jgi:ribonuclease HI
MKIANDHSLIRLSENSEFFDGKAPASTIGWKKALETDAAAHADIFTDGCCLGNPGPGGYAAIIVTTGHVVYGTKGGSYDTTNNRMELEAAISALRLMPDTVTGTINLHTDSRYVTDGMTSYLAKWKRNGWKTSGGDPVKNRDLWEQLDALCTKLGSALRWTWLKGHNGNRWNEMADEIAKSAAYAYENDQAA